MTPPTRPSHASDSATAQAPGPRPAPAPAPDPATLTPSPLRNRIRVHLEAPAPEVWALVGDLARLPEYSSGLARVEPRLDPSGACRAYVCHFRPLQPGEPGVLHREEVRWYAPGRGFASLAEEPNAFGLLSALTLVAVEPRGAHTLLAWEQRYDAADLPANLAAFDEALADIAAHLVRRFGGRIEERWVQPARTAPPATPAGAAPRG